MILWFAELSRASNSIAVYFVEAQLHARDVRTDVLDDGDIHGQANNKLGVTDAAPVDNMRRERPKLDEWRKRSSSCDLPADRDSARVPERCRGSVYHLGKSIGAFV